MKSINLNLEIDFRSGVPIYIQIMDQIKHLIASEQLSPGDQLPTVRQLATNLRINFNTVARSYKLLDEEGIISTQHGRGTFILELSSTENGEKLRRENLIHLTRNYLQQIHQLGIKPDTLWTVLNEEIKYWKETGSPIQPDNS